MSDLISRQKILATLDFADKALDEDRTVEKYKELLTECIKALPPVQPVPCEDAISREFEEIVLEYLDKDICPYPEYKGKPYFSIKYKENGKQFIGFSTYKPEVFSQYLKDYFMPSVQPKKEDNTMDIYSDLLRVKHGTMSIDSLIDKVWCGRKAGE